MNTFLKNPYKTLLLSLFCLIATTVQSQDTSSRTLAPGSAFINPIASPNASDYPIPPFIESWDVGTFTANNWAFSDTDNNWCISLTSGNPVPCAEFSSLPHRVNYSQALISDTIDATSYMCAVIWLDFDLKISSVNNTGMEKMTVEVYRQGAWSPIDEVVNSSSTGWVKHHVRILGILNDLFQIRFVAHGGNSADIQQWQLDNIHVYGSCNAPKHLWLYGLHKYVQLDWSTPDCTQNDWNDLILDDGSMEYCYCTPADSLQWYGNKFLVGEQSYGFIQKISLYFVDSYFLPGSPQTLTIDFFDSTRTLIGSSAPFLTNTPDDWINVPINNVPFNGDFYAMVKFNNLPGNPYCLAADETGPNVTKDLAWTINGAGVWSKIGLPLAQPCVFLCRASVFVYNDHSSETTDTNLIGYNVFRSSPDGAPPFVQCNTNPVTGNSYIDYTPSNYPMWTGWNYYVTAVYMNLADSTVLCEPSSDTANIIVIGVRDERANFFSIHPNPAVEKVQIVATFPIIKVEVFDQLGQIVYSTGIKENNTLDIDLSFFARGVYVFRITTTKGIQTDKVVVTE
ncbi:MAG: T9SS type A sorting domain-containing protein [Bacteroidales bacterium]|nr:T9SS type A sorting domain-containing protein [Bacteroidales bacterium]